MILSSCVYFNSEGRYENSNIPKDISFPSWNEKWIFCQSLTTENWQRHHFECRKDTNVIIIIIHHRTISVSGINREENNKKRRRTTFFLRSLQLQQHNARGPQRGGYGSTMLCDAYVMSTYVIQFEFCFVVRCSNIYGGRVDLKILPTGRQPPDRETGSGHRALFEHPP